MGGRCRSVRRQASTILTDWSGVLVGKTCSGRWTAGRSPT